MKTLSAFLACFLIAFDAWAQDFSKLASAVAGMEGHLYPICIHTNFSAVVRFDMLGPTGEIARTLPFHYSAADGFHRQDILVNEMTEIPAEARRIVTQVGLDEMAIIARKDATNGFLVFPKIHAYCDLAIPDTGRSANKKYHFEETVTGAEDVGGEACTTAKLVEKAHPEEVATVWRIKRLEGFPLKAEMKQPGKGGLAFRFSEVELKKPSAEVFAIPTNYVKLANPKAAGAYAAELVKRREGKGGEQ